MQARHEAAMEALRQRAQSSGTSLICLFVVLNFVCSILGNEELLKKQAMEALQVLFFFKKKAYKSTIN